MIAALLALFVGTAAALTPSANPAEAIDQAKCFALQLLEFTQAGQPVSITHTAIVPRDGPVPSHCWVTAEAGAFKTNLRFPIAPWTGDLLLDRRERGDDLNRGLAIAWSDARDLPNADLAVALTTAYYGRAPTHVLP